MTISSQTQYATGTLTVQQQVCTYRQRLRRLVQAQGGRQQGGADGKAGAAGIATLAPRASGGIPPTLSAQSLGLLLDHQDLVIAKVTQQGVV